MTEKEITCPKCGDELKDLESNVCWSCGAPLGHNTITVGNSSQSKEL